MGSQNKPRSCCDPAGDIHPRLCRLKQSFWRQASASSLNFQRHFQMVSKHGKRPKSREGGSAPSCFTPPKNSHLYSTSHATWF